jgi:hypothetical protein
MTRSVALILAAACLGGCDADEGAAVGSLPAWCVEGEPCVWVTDGSGTDLSAAYDAGAELGVFDGLQGLVATWITLVVHDAPPDNPTVRVTLTDSSGATLNKVNTLKWPFKDGGGFRYKNGHMVELLETCCAVDYDDIDATLTIDILWEGHEPIVYSLPVLLKASPWPL